MRHRKRSQRANLEPGLARRVQLRRLRLEPLEDRRLLDGATLFVDVDALGAATGASWPDAFTDLQPALAAAETLNTDADPENDIAEIWLAAGTYKPTAQLEVDDVRTATFSLVANVNLIGGFAGDETTIDQRELLDGHPVNETTLSGDLGTVDDPSDNACTVVFADLPSGTAIAMDGLTITAGSADGSGGGVRNVGSGTLTISRCTIRGNSAFLVGGGLSNDTGRLVVIDSTLSGNSASSGGGIFSASGALSIERSELHENVASAHGGAVHIEFGTLIVSTSSLNENTAIVGGAISSLLGTTTVLYSELGNNVGRSRGGTVFSEFGGFSTIGSTYSDNSATYGGALYVVSGATNVESATITGNLASEWGGGIHAFRDALTIVDSTLSENTANERGGAVYCVDCELTMVDSTVEANETTHRNGIGGGVFACTGTFNVTGSSFHRNSVPGGGGAIYRHSGTSIVVGSEFTGNVAFRGSGIYSTAVGTFTVTNSVFVGNSATSGAGIYNEGASFALTHSTITRNSASSAGGGMYVFGDSICSNSIVAGNAAPNDPNIYGLCERNASLIGVITEFVSDPHDGGDGWADDPTTPDVDESANNDYGDLRLTPGSPAIDAGNDALTIDAGGNPLVTDITAVPRRLDGDDDGVATVDIGAYEFIPPVVGQLYYRGSWLDHGDGDGAIAINKQPLRPGQTALGENYSNYYAGINGVMVDFNKEDDGTEFSADDFVFRVGNSDDPAEWAAGPAATAIETRPGEGMGGTVRVSLAWPNGAILNTWLEVTVLANENTGLTEDHVFYFGNAVGETGNDPGNALVTAADVIAVRDHPRGPGNRAGIDNRFDVDRDRLVNAVDVILARNFATGPFSALRLISPVEAVEASAEGEGREKGAGLFSAKHPPGRSGKTVLTPFSERRKSSADAAQTLPLNANAGPAELLRVQLRRQDERLAVGPHQQRVGIGIEVPPGPGWHWLLVRRNAVATEAIDPSLDEAVGIVADLEGMQPTEHFIGRGS